MKESFFHSLRHVPYTRLMRIEPGQERSTTRTATTAIIHLSKSNAIIGQPIYIGGLDFRSIATDIGKA